jgi:hypothetical protein
MMHTLHFDPGQRLLIGLLALAVTLVLALVAAAPLGQLDLTSDRASVGAASTPATPTSARHAISEDAPRWIKDPLASPLESLVRPARG